MKEITLEYIYDWSMTDKFDELYHKPVCIKWNLKYWLLTESDIHEYSSFDGDIWDEPYAKLIDIDDPDNNPKIYVCSSLKILLEYNGFHKYEWPIKIYWVFWIRPTTRTHIAQIWKADILNEGW